MGRSRRPGNPSNVIYLYEYYVENSWDSKAVWRNIEKIIPEAMAVLNKQVFDGGEGEDSMELGEWVLQDGELTRLEDA